MRTIKLNPTSYNFHSARDTMAKAAHPYVEKDYLEIIKDRLYFACFKTIPKANPDVHYFCTDTDVSSVSSEASMNLYRLFGHPTYQQHGTIFSLRTRAFMMTLVL